MAAVSGVGRAVTAFGDVEEGIVGLSLSLSCGKHGGGSMVEGVVAVLVVAAQHIRCWCGADSMGVILVLRFERSRW